MGKPVLVILGRPNVCKSTLFNRIVGRQAAIVEDTPGVTRDRNYMDAEYDDRQFTVVDTGGFFVEHDDNIFVQIKEQALFAIEEADVIIHLLDGKEGINPHDADLVEVLRTSEKPVIWAVNKIDGSTREDRVLDFFSLGIEEPLPVSASNGYQFDELMERVVKHLPERHEEAVDFPKVAVVGRPNAGKSTLVNTLLGKKRLLVSPVPGTTRDSIDTVCTYYKRKYLFIDTAGIRRKDRHGYSVERFAMVRALRSIERADVCVLLIDASEGLVSDDQKIAGLIQDKLKGCVIVLNKWDLVDDPDKRMKQLTAKIKDKLWFFQHAPVLTASGLEKKRITKIFSLVDQVAAERKKRIPTAELNKIVQDLNLPSYRGRRVKVYYMTQFGIEPPSFTLFTNMPEGIRKSDTRHIEAKLRERYGFGGTPIRLYIRKRT
jgi:GTP-binding protein